MKQDGTCFRTVCGRTLEYLLSRANSTANGFLCN